MLTYRKPNGEWGCKGVDLRMVEPSVYGALRRLREDKKQFTAAVISLLNYIETELDKRLLLESEKEQGYYWAFDTKEMTRGSQLERYQAYDIALKNHFLQVDEVREAEDYDAMGFNWLTMGLGDILLNPDTMEVFTPNTGQTSNLGNLSTEQRGNDKHDPKSGRFALKNSSGSVDKSAKGSIIKSENLKMSAPLQKSPDFSKYEVKSDLKAVEAFKETVSAKLGIPISDISLDGIRNTEVLEPFINRIEQIQKETGMKMPALRSLSVIDGDETCIAGYKRYENTLYISSKYFNSKDALVDTLKEWANNGTLPKQGKTIRYLAEHETAHIRIPVSDIESEEGFEIFRKAMKRGLCDNDKNIYEFYADCEALDRMGYSDKNIQDAVEYLKRRRKK